MARAELLISNSFIVVFILFIFSSCSLTQKTVLRGSHQIFEDGSLAYQKIGNWQQFEQDFAANILQLEALYEFDSKNLYLLALLIKGYSSLAFGLHETLALDPKQKKFREKQAMYFYNKALSLGQDYLERRKLAISDLLKVMNDQQAFQAKLNRHLKKRDHLAAFYIAQAWGGFLNLNRQQTRIMPHLGAVTQLADWVCQQDPQFEWGACYLFKAMVAASLPPALTHSEVSAEKLIAQYKQLHPESLLGEIIELQMIELPQKRKALTSQKLKKLKNKFAEKEELLQKPAYRAKPNPFHSRYQLFNVIAQKRFELILQHQEVL